MEIPSIPLSEFIVLLVLGLRHGLDPDHITIIDGYTYSLHQRNSIWTKWVGTFFALGHGIMVTVIAFVLSLLKNHFKIPVYLDFLIEWVPLLILLSIGISNVLMLLKKKQVNLNFRKLLITKAGPSHLNPISIIFTGLVFGFIFDTSTQIAAFGLAISSAQQWIYALLGGLIFSIGLMLTGTFDSLYLSKLLKTFDQKKIQKHRLKLNILITVMCFIIPAYKIACIAGANIVLNDFQNNMVGIGFISIIFAIYTDLYLRYKFQSKK